MNRAELVSHKRATQAFIDSDPTSIVLVRKIKLRNTRAGKDIDSTLTLDPQKVHLTRHTSTGADEAFIDSGATAWFKTLLVGRWDMDIVKDDEFEAEGISYKVDFVETDRKYQTRARISARQSG